MANNKFDNVELDGKPVKFKMEKYDKLKYNHVTEQKITEQENNDMDRLLDKIYGDKIDDVDFAKEVYIGGRSLEDYLLEMTYNDRDAVKSKRIVTDRKEREASNQDEKLEYTVPEQPEKDNSKKESAIEKDSAPKENLNDKEIDSKKNLKDDKKKEEKFVKVQMENVVWHDNSVFNKQRSLATRMRLGLYELFTKPVQRPDYVDGDKHKIEIRTQSAASKINKNIDEDHYEVYPKEKAKEYIIDALRNGDKVDFFTTNEKGEYNDIPVTVQNADAKALNKNSRSINDKPNLWDRFCKWAFNYETLNYKLCKNAGAQDYLYGQKKERKIEQKENQEKQKININELEKKEGIQVKDYKVSSNSNSNHRKEIEKKGLSK